MSETPQDSDVHAADGTIAFDETFIESNSSARQPRKMDSAYERIDLDDHWIKKWKKSEVPVYVVLVVVPSSKTDWPAVSH